MAHNFENRDLKEIFDRLGDLEYLNIAEYACKIFTNIHIENFTNATFAGIKTDIDTFFSNNPTFHLISTDWEQLNDNTFASQLLYCDDTLILDGIGFWFIDIDFVVS